MQADAAAAQEAANAPGAPQEQAVDAAHAAEPASPGGSRRRGGPPRLPPIRFSGNHIKRPLRLRHEDADQQRIRKRVSL